MTAQIDRFATLVEETGAGRHHRRPVDADPSLLALVRFAHDLGREPHPPVRQRFRDELHTRLLAEFAAQATQGEPVSADAAAEKTQVVRIVRPSPGLAARAFKLGARARLAAVIGVATGAVALSGVSLASSDAVPGDLLYSVKRSGEQAQLVIAGSDSNRGQLHLDFARTRLVEARQVAPNEVGAVLAEMDREITEGVRLLFSAGFHSSDEAPIDSVTSFVAQQRADLLQLRAAVRTAADPARRSLDLLDAVEIRANQLRATLAGACTVNSADRFGPKPAC
jgi:hypothetical protein